MPDPEIDVWALVSLREADLHERAAGLVEGVETRRRLVEEAEEGRDGLRGKGWASGGGGRVRGQSRRGRGVWGGDK